MRLLAKRRLARGWFTSLPGGISYNGLYGEAPPERSTVFRLKVFKRVGVSHVEVYERVDKSVI